jgi:hypothetical protein
MNITIKQNEFFEFLDNNLDLTKYEYKFLRDEIQLVRTGRKSVHEDSFFNVQGDSWILVIHVESLLVYGNNWSTDQFEEIKQFFDLNKFTNYLIAGEAKLIASLTAFFKVNNLRIEKDRLFYRTNKIEEIKVKNTQIRLANHTASDDLSEMLKTYYHEEYNGENDKSLSEMRGRIEGLIFTRSIYILRTPSNEIASFCTIIDPDIGILFTKVKHRNLGYAKEILTYCADILLRKNGHVFLMTDKSKIESNRTCQSAGFQKYFDFTFTRINNTKG